MSFKQPSASLVKKMLFNVDCVLDLIDPLIVDGFQSYPNLIRSYIKSRKWLQVELGFLRDPPVHKKC